LRKFDVWVWQIRFNDYIKTARAFQLQHYIQILRPFKQQNFAGRYGTPSTRQLRGGLAGQGVISAVAIYKE
jgi:hypothetical protein